MDPDTVLSGVGLAITLGGLAWKLRARFYGFRIFFADPRGLPKIDINILGPTGSSRPDGAGMLYAPRSWAKRHICIYDQKTGRELLRVRLSGTEDGPEKIVVPDDEEPAK